MWNLIGRVRQRKLNISKNDSSKSHIQQDTVVQSSVRKVQQTRAATTQSSCNIKKDKCTNIEQLSSNDLLNFDIDCFVYFFQ